MATYRDNPEAVAHIEIASRAMLARIAYEVAEDAKRLVPVDTGLLKSRIEADKPTPGPRTSPTVRVWARTSYARFVELGTSRMRARPYLRAALWKRRDL